VLSRYIAPISGLPGNASEYTPGCLSLAVSPYGTAPPYTDLVEWHSFAFLVNSVDQLIKRFIVGNLGEVVSPVSGPVSVNQGPALDPFDRYLFAADSNANNIQACAIDQSEGTLTLVPGSPWTAGKAPLSVEVDVTGRFLYVVNSRTNTVSGFYTNRPREALTPMSPPTFATGNMPIAILTVGSIK
jgi:6-phosphogluconolactonase